MSIYYQDDNVTLHHGDAFDFIAALPDQSIDCVITDPPFDARTHGMARSNNRNIVGNRALSGTSTVRFESFDHETQRALFADLGRVTRRWVVSNLATDTAFRFQLEPPEGLRVLRIGAWIKTNPMPMISADRPAMGWEPIGYMHREDTKPAWNGGGRALNFNLPTSQGSGHPTQKPLPMVQAFVRNFSNQGDTILDPFMGTGTTVRAALDEGRKVVGVEQDERWLEFAAKRIEQGALDLAL